MTEKNRRNLIIAVILVVILAVVLLLLFLFGNRLATTEPVSTEPTPTTTGKPLESAAARPVTPTPSIEALNPAPVAPARTGAVQTAELFAQRFGSWSTHEAPYRNLLDLFPVMTDRYQKEVQALAAKAVINPTAAYSGTTSAKINSSAVTNSDKIAVINVMLQQTKTDDKGTTKGYRTLKVSLMKVGEDWKVDSATWAD